MTYVKPTGYVQAVDSFNLEQCCTALTQCVAGWLEMLSDFCLRCRTSPCHDFKNQAGARWLQFSESGAAVLSSRCSNCEPSLWRQKFVLKLAQGFTDTHDVLCIFIKSFRSVTSYGYLSQRGCNLFDPLLLAANFFTLYYIWQTLLSKATYKWGTILKFHYSTG